ncbi:hypothetical protein BXZ70DRAFT_974531 [Cristinia sonorae]|uniref:NF-X1-type domain-containing protein n=1 Tax=Cristinia sonorae TaxID=1940300 RepID=A0A8K0UN19_9AGAR|nr:hypothetical protein BXZ70DRAFT_974531 [Cristinia sonorae]
MATIPDLPIPHAHTSNANTVNDRSTTPSGHREGGNRRGRPRRQGRAGGQVRRPEGGTEDGAERRAKPEVTNGGEGGEAKSGRSRPRRNRSRKPSGHESSTSAGSSAPKGPLSLDSRNPNRQDRPRRGRATRFKSELSEVPSGSGGLEEKETSEKYRNITPKLDDLTSTLIHSLKVPPFRDCLICFAAIRPFEPIWSCSSSSPTSPGSDGEKDDQKDPVSGNVNAQCCWTPFHLKCIRQWASKSVKELADAWRARGEDKPGSWRCPGCQSTRMAVPSGYWCFCGSVADPKPPRLATPHSCAANCSRSRTCGHACPLSCHPGPCPPCQVTVRQPCFCGREILTFRCSLASSQARHDVASHFSCSRKCDRKLGCGNHTCQDTCHDGPCQPCTVKDVAKCYCGKEEKEIACGEGDAKESVAGVGAEQRRWVGRYTCENNCDRLYDCGIHRCEKPCHPQSATTSVCPRSPALVTRCPCSKHDLSSASASAFPPGTKLVRTACTDPIPTCQSMCMKTLDGCSHVCSVTCHAGPCPPCSIMLVRPCRCGATTRNIRCSDERAGPESEILCNQPCPALRACGKHQCNRLCCPLASLAAMTKGKGKKKATVAPVLDVSDEAGWHECDLVCGKVLGCGNHYCEQKDHRGICRPCLVYSYEDMVCYCGRTILEPPIPCGTRIVCTQPCPRPRPACGHPKAPHHCHEDPTPCPPCVHLTQKECACGKKMVDNVRCSQETVSCGTTCGKLLACGFHHCDRLCHSDGCGPCNAVCGKPRKLCHPALHACTLPCHAPAACSEAEPCRAIVNITCPCGRIVQPVPCGRSTSSPGGREGSQQLKCSNECAIAKRNARLADALGISPDRVDKTQVTYHESLIAFARGEPGFCAMVEKTFAEFIMSEKKSQVLPHMHPTKRKFVYDLAAVYRMDTQMIDQEPKRSVELIRRIDSRIPSPTLSSTIASTPASSSAPSSFLGKLTDLRAPANPRPVPGRSPNASPAPSAPSSRAWTSVVSRPQAPAASRPIASGSTWGVHNSTVQSAPRTATSRLVPLSSTPKSSTPVAAPSAPVQAPALVPAPDGQSVPDSWEEDE